MGEDVRNRLAARGIPGTDRSWLDVAIDAATQRCVDVAAVCRGGRTEGPASGARKSAFVMLSLLGYSSVEIADVWCVNPTTVSETVRRSGRVPPPSHHRRNRLVDQCQPSLPFDAETDLNIGPDTVDAWLAWIDQYTRRAMDMRGARVRAAQPPRERAA